MPRASSRHNNLMGEQGRRGSERAADAKREADMQLALAREATATEQVSVVHGLLIASSDCL